MNASDEIVTIRPIITADDHAWPAWQTIFNASFPFDERLDEAYFLTLFDNMKTGKPTNEQVFVMEGTGYQDNEDVSDVIGMAFTEQVPSLGIGFLWYLATVTNKRNSGYGSQFYQMILDEMQSHHIGQLIFEVEIPEKTNDPDMAWRRINWYRRKGARILEGVKYLQMISPDIPPKEMWLMAHLLAPAGAKEIFANAKAYFGEYLEKKDTIMLV